MTMKRSTVLCAAASLLAACETYTEKTSPCFGHTGEPTVTRATLLFATSVDLRPTVVQDCVFDALPRPQ
jgi:hypothetical protein